MRYLHLGPAMVPTALFAPETDGRAEVESSASPVNDGAEGRLTHWSVVGCGLVGGRMAQAGTVEEAQIPKVALSYKSDYPSKNGHVVENLTGGHSV